MARVDAVRVARRPKAPLENYVKIHVDAGVRTSRGGSAATICRDRQGNCLGISALVVTGVVGPAALEAIACREAISLAQDLQLHNFVMAPLSAKSKPGLLLSIVLLLLRVGQCRHT